MYNQLFVNVDEVVSENQKLKNDLAFAVSSNNQLQAQIQNLTYAVQQANFNTIQHYEATIASMKAQKELTPRQFNSDSNGNIVCIESGGKKKPVGTFKYESAFILSTIINGEKQENIVVSYRTGLKDSETVIIPLSDIKKNNLSKYFASFKMICKKEIADDYFYITLMDILNTNLKIYEIPEYPGISLNIKDGSPDSAYFNCCETQINDIYKKYISEPYQKKILPAVNKTPKAIMNGLHNYLKSMPALMLVSFGLSGIISTFLEYIRQNTINILTVSVNNTDAEALADCISKTYGRKKASKSLTISKTELTKLLADSKDETLVLRDDSASESLLKRTASIDTILGFKSSEKCKPFNIVILSNTIQYFIPDGKAIILEPDEDFGRNISEEERYKLSESLDEMYRYFVDTFCRQIKNYGSELAENIYKTKKESPDDFTSDTLNTTFAVLYSVLLTWSDIFGVELSSEIKPFIKKQILASQNRETGKDLSIINDFSRVLNSAVSAGIINVTELNRNMKFRDNQNTGIINGELMMIEESVIKEVFLPRINSAQTVNSILTSLNNMGCLVSTNGHRKLTTVYDDKRNPVHRYFIAFKFIDMINSETLDYIENLKYRQYFSDNANDEKFIPLIQNGFGKTAGQLLIPMNNQHRCVTGKSGAGKTEFLNQLLPHLSKAGNRVVILDSSGSFKKQRLLESLSEKFVRDNITIYDAVQNGLPVNLFHTYSNDKPVARRNMLYSIIGEAVHSPSQNQEITLKTIVKKMLQSSDSPTYIDFLEQFEDTEDTSEKSLSKKLSNLFEELIEDDSDKQKDDWFSFLNKCRDIVIISLNEPDSENGNQLTDMLLASLYHAQLHQDEYRQLSIFIDEIQNQNVSEHSIISKILKEGRKFSIDLNFATQYISDMKKSRILRQAGLYVHFKPDSTTRNAVADMLGMKKNEMWMLDSLNKGECYIQGSIYNFDTDCNDEVIIKGKTYINEDSPLNKK